VEELNNSEPPAEASEPSAPPEPLVAETEAAGDAAAEEALEPLAEVGDGSVEAPVSESTGPVTSEVSVEAPAPEAAPESTSPMPVVTPLIVIQDPAQQTLELGAVETPFAPEAAAAAAATAAATAAALSGATPVHTYGEPSLDEMVDELAATTPDAANAPSATDAATREGAVLATPQPNLFVITPIWPFLAYLGVWLAFAVALALTMRGPAAQGNLYLSPYYSVFVWGGLVLAALVVPLVFGIWLWIRSKHEKGDRGGVFVSAFLKGALGLFLGVAMWWVAYYAAVALS
jgi:hypothetical protein